MAPRTEEHHLQRIRLTAIREASGITTRSLAAEMQARSMTPCSRQHASELFNGERLCSGDDWRAIMGQCTPSELAQAFAAKAGGTLVLGGGDTQAASDSAADLAMLTGSLTRLARASEAANGLTTAQRQEVAEQTVKAVHAALSLRDAVRAEPAFDEARVH